MSLEYRSALVFGWEAEELRKKWQKQKVKNGMIMLIKFMSN